METIEIALNKLYSLRTPPSLPRQELKKLLLFATKESHFLFDGTYYDQIDGVAMGSPLGPILANIFMGHFEEKWITNKINSIDSPLCWKRYVDDTFCLFKTLDEAHLFLNYLNSKHPNIKFTCETEQNNQLSFLDINIIKKDDLFLTTIYRKKTFTGLYTKWDSFTPRKYKINLINTLLDRFWKICSNETLFNKECEYLKDLLMKNGYPSGIIHYNINNFIKKRNLPEPQVLTEGPKKLTLNIILPFLGYQSDALRKKINNLLFKFCGGIKANVIFRNRITIGSNFKIKDKLALNARSGIVYEFTCDECGEIYDGKTIRCLWERKKEHFEALTKPNTKKKSSIASHLQNTCHNTSFNNNFKIIDNAKNRYELLIKESLNILQRSPSLNENNDFELTLY